MNGHFWRRTFGIASFLAIASCAGGGGCGGCGGAIPGGFPRESVIQNAGAVRITRPGLDVFAAGAPAMLSETLNLKDGVFAIQIPKTDTGGSVDLPWPLPDIGYTIHICPGGAKPEGNPPECVGEAGVAAMKLHLDAVAPNTVRASGTVPIRLRDLTVNVENDGPDLGDFGVGLGAGGCNGDTPNFDYKEFPFQITIPLANETLAPRTGYTKLDWDRAVVDVQVSKDDVAVCKDCGVATELCNVVFDFVKDQAFNSLIGGVKDQLKVALASQFCEKANLALNPPCPLGSHPKDANCAFDANPNVCVPLALGTDLRMDLGRALASVSPGTSGGLDFLLAAGGTVDAAPDLPADNNPYAGHTPNGLTLSLLGGALAAPQSQCVPKADLALPTKIPLPDEMRQDKPAPWPNGAAGPHLGIALAGRFLQYAFGNAYNSGLLCMGVSTEQFQQLQSGLLSFLVPSLQRLTFEEKSAPVALTTRPQKPPTIKVGSGTDLKTDPLLTVGLPEFSVDFYIWSLDRFVRAFTFTGDLTIPVNLQTAKNSGSPNGGLLPVIGDVQVANPKVTNSDLLSEDPALIAVALSPVLGGFVSQVAGAIGAIDLSSALGSFGLAVTVPDGGIRKLSKAGDDFVGIFANLAPPATPANAIAAETDAHITARTVHPEAMSLTTLSRDKRPALHVTLSSPTALGTAEVAKAVEYSWAIDRGVRSAWSEEAEITVESDDLVFQGKHTLDVWARFVGEPASEDPTPARVPFAIDTLAPMVKVTSDARGRIGVSAWDFVSEPAALVARYRPLDAADAPASDWMPLAELIKLDLPHSVTVEVRDEAGNVGTGLIRGRPDGSLAASGCGCSTPGTARGPSGLWAVALLGGLLVLARHRRGRASPPPSRPRRPFARPLAAATVLAAAAANQGCSCGSDGDNAPSEVGCGADCTTPCDPALPMGQIGAYTSVATAKDGAIWVAGYNDGIYSANLDHVYGDLVVGRYDGAKQRVAWATVDGIPKRTDGSCPPAERSGWRNGETDPGDDVGLWTSLQLDPNGQPMVAYYDATNRALKFAFFDGQNWSNYALRAPGDAKSDIGRYAKMVVSNGNPVVAFSVNEPGNDGFLRSKITLAKSSTPSPHAAADWTFEDVSVDEKAPCRPWICDGADACIKETGQCSKPVTGCTPADCGGGTNVCALAGGKPTCQTSLPPGYMDTYPNALGDYIRIATAPEGLGIVAYDRIHGNLLGISNGGGTWTTAILDGETGARPNAVDTGDVGIGASLVIADNGDWHVSYVDGLRESLRYLRAPGGKAPKSVLVDDGFGLGAAAPPFRDGRHVVGDDSFLRVDDAGRIQITYQDATAGTLRMAIGTSDGKGATTWTVKAIAQPGRFAGFFPSFAGTGVVNYWRQLDPSVDGIVGDVALVTP